MSSHGLTRNEANDPVCLCGYRPAGMDFFTPWSSQHLKAKTMILEHAKAVNDAESANEWEAALDALAERMDQAPAPKPLRSPADPFYVRDAQYPRAGVRQTEDGRWLLSLWDGEHVLHVFDKPVFDDRQVAFDYGWLTIGACRKGFCTAPNALTSSTGPRP